MSTPTEVSDDHTTRQHQHDRESPPVFRELLERETLDEEEILEVTGLPPAPLLENREVLNGASSGGYEEFFAG